MPMRLRKYHQHKKDPTYLDKHDSKVGFDMLRYIHLLKKNLHNHLQVQVEDEQISQALDLAFRPGSVTLIIDGTKASQSNIDRFKSSHHYQQLITQWHLVENKKSIRLIEFHDSIDTILLEQTNGPIVVTLDYSNWKNEHDPLLEWDTFRAFLDFAKDQNCDFECEILRIKENGNEQRFKGFNPFGIPEWKPHRSFVLDKGRGWGVAKYEGTTQLNEPQAELKLNDILTNWGGTIPSNIEGKGTNPFNEPVGEIDLNAILQNSKPLYIDLVPLRSIYSKGHSELAGNIFRISYLALSEEAQKEVVFLGEQNDFISLLTHCPELATRLLENPSFNAKTRQSVFTT